MENTRVKHIERNKWHAEYQKCINELIKRRDGIPDNIPLSENVSNRNVSSRDQRRLVVRRYDRTEDKVRTVRSSREKYVTIKRNVKCVLIQA